MDRRHSSVRVPRDDYHHNVFFYYGVRGALLSSKGEALRETQAENNVTKALVNTLIYCSDSVRQDFLEWLGLQANEPYNFRLQTRSIEAKWLSPNAKKVLLGIVPPWASPLDESLISVAVEGEGSVPDAWVFGKGWVVLIESKVTTGLDPQQLAYHLVKLRAGPDRVLQKSWLDIYRFFQGLIDRSPQPDRFLISQFCNYLEVMGMAGFIGLRPEHFEYFIRRDDPDLKESVRSTMNSLASLVREQIKGEYPEFRMGRIGYSCWGTFFKGERQQDVAHQTIDLWPYKFEVSQMSRLLEP